MKNNQVIKKVLVFGTFDLLHPGHIFFLHQAKKLGRLYVVVSSDKNVKQLKKIITYQKEKVRMKNVKKIKIAYNVRVGEKKVNSWHIIKSIRPDIIALGYDQDKLRNALKNISEKYNFKIKVMKSFRPKIYKSSLLRKHA